MSKIYNLNADTKVIAKSVVSKRIFDCENAHVDVFAFDAGEELCKQEQEDSEADVEGRADFFHILSL